MNSKQKFLFLWRLPFRRKCWLLGCLLGSLAAFFIIHVLPSRYLRFFLGQPHANREFCVLATKRQMLYAMQIASLMKTVASNVPWPCQCLAQALCVNWLLRVEGIPSITYLGASLTNSDAAGMKAHAWVSVGPNIIIGHHDGTYAVVGCFTPKGFFNTI